MSRPNRTVRAAILALFTGVMLTMSAYAEGTVARQPGLERFLAKLDAGQQVTVVALADSNTEQTFHTRGALNFVGLL